jgi:hypothetical protein
MPGCSGWLYSLTIRSSRFSFTTPLSIPLLTEPTGFHKIMKEVELELLLPACPQLLRLDCTVSHSWQVVLIAARCCRCLLQLTVRIRIEEQQAGDAASAGPEPVVITPFLPQLLSFSLYGDILRPRPFGFDFSVLGHFTAPPHPQLRHVLLQGIGLPLSTSVTGLPAQPDSPLGGSVPGSVRPYYSVGGGVQTDAARLGGAAAESADPYLPARREQCEDDVNEPPFGPHQQQEMRQRVLDEAQHHYQEGRNML